MAHTGGENSHVEDELQHNGFAEAPRLDEQEVEIAPGYKPMPIRTSREDDEESEISSRASHDVPRNGFFSPHDPPIPEDSRPMQEERQAVGDEEAPVIQTETIPIEDSRPIDSQVPPESRDDSRSITSHEPTAPTKTKSTAHFRRPSTLPSMVFVVTALETIGASKDARKRKQLGDAVQGALTAIKNNDAVDPEIIFEPLKLATETGNVQLTTISLDCIGKLITYSYFAMPDMPPEEDITEKPPIPLIERAIDTICDCFADETTNNDVQLQIMKSLLAAVLNDKIIVHGAGLLKAVRQVYNIFLFSRSIPNQQVAQGTLTQMVGTVFERVKFRLLQKEARLTMSKPFSGGDTANGSQSDLHNNIIVTDVDAESGDGDAEEVTDDAPTSVNDDQSTQEPRQKMTLQSFENTSNFDDTKIAEVTTVTRAPTPSKNQRSSSGHYTNGEDVASEDDDEDETYIKDAFLVFRSMCRLSTKILPQEQLQDLRSQNMRSKLISLSIVRTLMNNNMDVFTSPLVTIRGSANEPTSFGQAINQYLRLAVSRNGSSAVRQVFEITCEIFWLIIRDMRLMLKNEIEVFIKEIYFSILERRNAPQFQKVYIMKILRRLSNEPRALVEMYLNYDCDRTALENMFQRMIEILSKFCTAPVQVSPQLQQHWQEIQAKELEADLEWREAGKIPPPLTTTALAQAPHQEIELPMEFVLKQNSLESLVRTLRSLLAWSQQNVAAAQAKVVDQDARLSLDDVRRSFDPSNKLGNSPQALSSDTPQGPGTPLLEDDPNQLEKAKQRKTALMNGIRQFNFKAKRGVKTLIADGFIQDDSPDSIAAFLLNNEDLDKAAIGEYLGEGEPQNVAIMHAFVDQMDFAKRAFVDSLRQFLQSFRLPGEAQKIDRFMLKFAERYMTGNPGAFANADTAYVLAYSVILLNTDQHSTKMKGRRMTLEDFVKNNRGINDNADLPEEYLKGIYDEIASNEIVLDTEREHAAALGITVPVAPTGITAGFFSRDLESEAAHQADQEMTNKTEQRLRMMLRGQKRLAKGSVKYIPATSSRHAGPMFDVTWMSFLSGFSGQMRETSNFETLKTVMEGLKLAIKLSCTFDLETPRIAFVTYLANLTNLSNPREMQAKNLEALKILLDLAITEGNTLKTSWSDILTCVSQVDRLQLITGGHDEDIVPDVRKGSIIDSGKSTPTPGRRSQTAVRKQRPGTGLAMYQNEIMQEMTSTEMIRTMDKIFSGTAELNGDAIVHFARALSEVSWNEIQSSGNSENPRMYSLQKLVEISYYNMSRVRFEWTNIWQVLGEHFNEVGCHNNTHIVYFALDSLRQLSKRFMEIEELPGFKFQKDFLKPFEHVIANSTVVAVKDMVLQCLIQMIRANGDNIRSGWKTMFGVFTVAAREPYETLVNQSYDQVVNIYNTRFGVVISQGAFADLVVCLTEFSKNLKFQKKSLQAIETLKTTVPRMLRTPECPLYQNMHSITAPEQQNEIPTSPLANRQTQEEQYWFPVLFAFHDVLMTGEDLEVRSQALNYLFDTLIKYGGDFPPQFWDTLWRQLLYPIFMVLRSKSEMTKVLNHEDLSVWLSTTMIQALRNMMALFTHYFDSLEYMLDRFLDLLALCICQENDTIARIGSNCLQTLILQNVTKFQLEHWHQIVTAFVHLFEATTATQLFTATNANWQASANEDDGFRRPSQGEIDNTLATGEQTRPAQSASPGLNGTSGGKHTTEEAETAMQPSPNPETADAPAEPSPGPQPASGTQQIVVTPARRRFFNKIITKCVLQLLMIETVNELFSNNEVYTQIPSVELLRLMALLKKSYVFAKKFNNDNELRRRLFQHGFMKQPPNLLKQESGSAATYVSILVRMYFDENEERRRSRAETESALIPLCVEIIRSYIDLDDEAQHRNIVAWRPVVIDIMEGYSNFPQDDFEKHVEKFYELAVDLLSRDNGQEVRLALQIFLRRVGEVRMGMAPLPTPTPTPTSPRSASSAFFGRSTTWSR